MSKGPQRDSHDPTTPSSDLRTAGGRGEDPGRVEDEGKGTEERVEQALVEQAVVEQAAVEQAVVKVEQAAVEQALVMQQAVPLGQAGLMRGWESECVRCAITDQSPFTADMADVLVLL
ncbi:unnamed protein product [Arctogadus glacialis]